MKVPFFSNDLIDEDLKDSWSWAFNEVVSNESLILGQSVSLFENEFAKFVGANHGIATSNGLDGLVLALRAARIGPGDVIAVPSHTFIATHLAVLHVGAVPHSIDVDKFGLLDLNLLESAKVKFKAVIPVHMHGCMVDMRRLKNWAVAQNVIVVEDASQAHGCERDGLNAGEFGDLAVFSFYPTKNLGALGDAGIVVTSNSHYNEELRVLRNYGSTLSSKYSHLKIGYNNRLDTIQAAILRINLTHLTGWNSKRNHLAKKYEALLAGLPIRILIDTNSTSVYHHFPVLTDERNHLQEYLTEHGVGTEIHYPNLASTEIELLTGVNNGEMAQGEIISQSTLSLPLSQWHTPEQIEYVAQTIHSYFEEKP